MLTNFKHAKVQHCMQHYVEYYYVNKPSARFCFPCNRNGTVEKLKMTKEALENYDNCSKGGDSKGRIVQGPMIASTSSIDIPAEGTCHCGWQVVLNYDDIKCDGCDRHYNTLGQELIPPHLRELECSVFGEGIDV